MRRRITTIIVAAALLWTACGEGRWGSAVTLRLNAAEELAPGDALPTADPDWELVVDRACLQVGAVALSASEPSDAGGGEDCFCHGDPPHCHGDCDGSEASDPALETRHVHAVVDLLTGEGMQDPLGVPPADYTSLRLVLAPPHDEGPDAHDHAHEPPPACADMGHSILAIEGTLRSTTGATAIPVLIDLHDLEVVTEPLDASPVIAADDEDGVSVHVALDLAHLLEHADLAPLTTASPGARVVIGGEQGAWPAIVEALAHALAEAVVYRVGAAHTGE